MEIVTISLKDILTKEDDNFFIYYNWNNIASNIWKFTSLYVRRSSDTIISNVV